MPALPPAPLLAEISTCERLVWDALVTGDATADERLLSAQFLGVYPDGFAGKADHSGQLDNGPTIASYDLQDLRLLTLGPDHALLSYLAVYQRVDAKTPEQMYVSSVWERHGEGWVNLFSQDTPAASQT